MTQIKSGGYSSYSAFDPTVEVDFTNEPEEDAEGELK